MDINKIVVLEEIQKGLFVNDVYRDGGLVKDQSGHAILKVVENGRRRGKVVSKNSGRRLCTVFYVNLHGRQKIFEIHRKLRIFDILPSLPIAYYVITPSFVTK